MSSYGVRAAWMVVWCFLINSCQACSSAAYPCILNGTTGNITSPGYPSNYPKNANLSWLIQVAHGYSVNLEFNDSFEIELDPSCQSDYLVIYDGSSTGNPIIGKYCGSDKPPNLYSSGSTLLVAFISNNERQSLGFYANYTAIRIASNCSAQQTDEENTNIILKDTSGNLITHFRNFYNNTRPAYCLWRLRAPLGYGIKITINALHFVRNVSCFQSSFELYKGSVIQENNLSQRYCRIKLEIPVIKYIAERAALLRLRTNQLSSWSENDAFNVRYEFIKKEKNKCSTLNNKQENSNIILTGHKGNFTIHTAKDSPNQSLQCLWQLRAPNGYQIKLRFLNFVMENDCSKTCLKIFDREYSKGTFCGPESPWVIYSTGGYLFVQFAASGYARTSRMGFVGVYEAVTNAPGRCSTINTEKMNSNIQLNDKDGVIMTPNYPSKYPPDFKCVWIINVPRQYRIRIHFVAFSVEDHACTYDYVEIRDGNNSRSLLKTKQKLCGDVVPHDVYSTSNQMRILFISDYSEQLTGFQAFFSVVKPEPGRCSPANTDQENNNIHIQEVPGTLNSPNYPQPFSPGIKCTWHITVPSPSRIQVHFYDFKISSCGFAFLEGYDGNCTCNASLGRYCGSSLPFNMFSTGNSLTLVFQSKTFTSYRGFNLSYSILKLGPGICSKGNSPFINDNLVLNKTRGYITSPNYPLPYTPGMQCTWHARAPKGYHVELSFTSIDFPLPCVRDYLEIRDGGSPYSPLKGRFCNLQSTFRVYASGRELWLRFVSQHTISKAYKGFFVKYRMIKIGNCSKDFDQSWNTNLNFDQSWSGSLTSPAYPSLYPADIQCTWKITVPYGFRVRLIFDQIILRESCKSDYIEVRDGYYSFSKSLGKFCKTEASSVKVESTDRRLLVHFQSGKRSELGDGFQASFTAFSSGRTTSGTFSAGAITVSLLVFAGFVLLTLSFVLMYWMIKKRYRQRRTSRPRDHDLAVISPMPVPPLDEIPDCLIAEDRPPSYAEAVNEDEEQQPSPESDAGPIVDRSEETVETRPRNAERGLDNEAFTSDPPTYESLYGVDPT